MPARSSTNSTSRNSKVGGSSSSRISGRKSVCQSLSLSVRQLSGLSWSVFSSFPDQQTDLSNKPSSRGPWPTHELRDRQTDTLKEGVPIVVEGSQGRRIHLTLFSPSKVALLRCSPGRERRPGPRGSRGRRSVGNAFR